MAPGETILSGASVVCDCGTKFEFEIMKSPAGWYVGTTCRNIQCQHVGEPNSRESQYYDSKGVLEYAVKTNSVRWRE
jgi:hypothetical protein